MTQTTHRLLTGRIHRAVSTLHPYFTLKYLALQQSYGVLVSLFIDRQPHAKRRRPHRVSALLAGLVDLSAQLDYALRHSSALGFSPKTQLHLIAQSPPIPGLSPSTRDLSWLPQQVNATPRNRPGGDANFLAPLVSRGSGKIVGLLVRGGVLQGSGVGVFYSRNPATFCCC